MKGTVFIVDIIHNYIYIVQWPQVLCAVHCAHMEHTIPCYSVLWKPRCFGGVRNTYLHNFFWIICTFMPFSNSDNLIHTAHNGTE